LATRRTPDRAAADPARRGGFRGIIAVLGGPDPLSWVVRLLLLKFLRKLVGRRDALVDAGRRTSGADFVRAVGSADVFVIAAMQSEGLDAATFTPEQLLAELERVARDLNDREGGFEVFIYERDGTSRLPFFSSQDHCQTFCGEYSKRANRVFPFQALGVKGSVIASCSKGVDQLVLNDWTPDERPLSDEEMRLLRGAWA
jgi:hypothetical protein